MLLMPETPKALVNSECPKLNLLARGKVRDVYALPDSDNALLFVATDRVSAFDVVMLNGIPYKGQLLTQLSAFWFEHLKDIIPNHYITSTIEDMPASVQEYADQLKGRSMLVKKCQVLKCEAIVRGYLTGSAYSEYLKSGTMHGEKLEANLPESYKFPSPIFTPSTKADVGDKDENIHVSKLPSILPSPDLAPKLVSAALAVFNKASAHALSSGLLLADTKFEFGLLPSTNELILIDEVLTPDSSRFWPAAEYKEGAKMTGFDKQFLREWLNSDEGWKTNAQGVEIPLEVVAKTWARYLEAFKLLTGREFVPV